MLAEAFLGNLREREGAHIPAQLSPIELARLSAQPWVGNVRELRNAVESMVVLDHDGIINMDDVEEDSPLKRGAGTAMAAGGPNNLVGRPLTEVERYYIEQALAATQGNREEAARMLGIGERTLYRNIQEWKQQDRIKATLAEVHGDVAAAAQRLGLKESVLERKIKKWGWRDGQK